MTRLVLFSFLFVALACGDDDTFPADGSTPDVPGTNDLSIAGDLRQAEFDLSAGQCECNFERFGHASVAACVADLDAVTPAVRRCAEDSVAPYIAELRTSLECLTELTLEYIACNARTTCDESDARTACFDASEAARRLCVLSETAFDWLDDERSCLSDVFVGPAEDACPDVSATGMGEIATFDTTLRGDDTTAGCFVTDHADVSVEWTAPAAGDYEFTADTAAADVFLYALDSCGGTEVACETETSLTLTLTADETVILVVDGYTERDVGSVSLSVAAL